MLPTPVFWGFPGGFPGGSTCNAGDPGLIPGLGRSPGGGHGNPLGFTGGSNGKDSACNAGDPGSIPEERTNNPLQNSCPQNAMDRGARRLQSMGSKRVRHDRVTNTFRHLTPFPQFPHL